jgi:hypothetical protein
MRLSSAAVRVLTTAALVTFAVSVCIGCGSGQSGRTRGRAQQVGSATEPRSGSAGGNSPSDPLVISRVSLERSMAPAIADVSRHDGTVQAAVMLDTWHRPLVLGEQLTNPMRLWSLSKAIVAVALLRERERLGIHDDGLEPYLERALERSDNCAMRELTVDLQDAAGGIAGARRAIAEVVTLAGGTINIETAQTDREGAVCLSPSYRDLTPGFAKRTALLAGTATWTIADAIDFIHGLEAGTADLPEQPSVSRLVLNLMRDPKRPSREPSAGKLVATPSWGAGEVFASSCWRLAYKGGWGGAQAHIPWLATQMGAVGLPKGHTLAFVLAVHPYEQPIDDDPGHTTAPQGISHVLAALRRRLSALGGCA